MISGARIRLLYAIVLACPATTHGRHRHLRIDAAIQLSEDKPTFSAPIAQEVASEDAGEARDTIEDTVVHQRDLEELLMQRSDATKSSAKHLALKFVTPYTGYLLSDFYFAKKNHPVSRQVLDDELAASLDPKLLHVAKAEQRHRKARGLIPRTTSLSLRETDPRKVFPGAIVFVDNLCVREFIDVVLPRIETCIVLITGRELLPNLGERDTKMDMLHQSPKIAHWFAQDPIYKPSEKNSGFIYGLREDKLELYNKQFEKSRSLPKLPGLENFFFKTKAPEPLSRQHYPTGRKMGNKFYEAVANVSYLFSPAGDHPDTYRNAEAIGLGTVPVSDISKELYGDIYGNSMVFLDEKKIIEIFKSDQRREEFDERRLFSRRRSSVAGTDRRLVLFDFWKNKTARAVQQASCKRSN